MEPTRTDTDTDFGPAMRGRASPFTRRPLEGPPTPPAWKGGKRPPRAGGWPRALRWACAALLVVLLVAGLSGVALLGYVSARIDRQEVAGLQGSRPLNVLVTGTDSRAGMTREQQNELTTGSQGGDLTDTIFVLQAGGGKTAMLAFPRDLYVTRCDGSRGRINAAVAIGGPSCLVQTITDLSGIEISHHIEVDFLGFRDIVDAVGGVELCLDRPIQDRDSGLDLPAGCQVMDGVDALGFVRVRKIDNDLQRIQRQQQFVKALANRVLSTETLANPLTLFETATATADALTADARLGPFDLAWTAWAMRGIASGLDDAYTVPVTDASIGGASVLQIEPVAAEELFSDFASGALLRDATAPAERPEPQEIEVSVRNGARVEGLAGRVAEQLRSTGFVVLDVGNSAEHEATVIRYPAGERVAAEVLRDASGRPAELVEDPAVSAVTIDLGTNATASS